MMAHNPPGGLSDRDHLAKGWLDRRFERKPAKRKIQNFAAHGFAIAARKLAEFSRGAAFVTPERRRRRALVGDNLELFRETGLFQGRAAEHHAKMPPFRPYHVAFEPPEF